MDVSPDSLITSLIERNVVRNRNSARCKRSSRKYWLMVWPVSALNRWRKRDAERFTSAASSAVSHAREKSVSICEITSSTLRSIVMRTRNEDEEGRRDYSFDVRLSTLT